MQYLNGVRTANNDAHSNPADTQFICFTVTERARVYILYDARATDQPQWLKDSFVDKHEETVENTDSDYEFYSGVFSPGRVCLGGNDAPGVRSMYLVFVGPDEWEPAHQDQVVMTGRYFDGDGDHVEIGSVGTYDTVTIECWIKWFSTSGNHPILNVSVLDIRHTIFVSTVPRNTCLNC